jgi:hypothetical protein
MPDYSSVVDPSAPRDQWANALGSHDQSMLSSNDIPSSNIPQRGGYSYGFAPTQSLAGNHIPEIIVDKNPALISSSNLNASKLVGGRRHRRHKSRRHRRFNKSVKSRRFKRSRRFPSNNKSKKRGMMSGLFKRIIGGKKSRKMRGGSGYAFDMSSSIAGMPIVKSVNTCRT